MTAENECSCTCVCDCEVDDRKPVTCAEDFEEMIVQVHEAQKQYATFTQEQVDKIFKAAALAANKARIPLA